MKNRIVTDRYRIVLNKTNTVSNFEDNRGKPHIKFVENPSWRKRDFKFSQLLLLSQKLYFHNQQLFGFLQRDLFYLQEQCQFLYSLKSKKTVPNSIFQQTVNVLQSRVT